MSSDRPFYFFELSGKSEVVLGWKILFGTIYRNTWGMDFPPQNEIWTRNSLFFSSQAGIQRLFLDVQSLTGLYTDIRSERIGDPKTGYESRPTSVFFSSQAGIQRSFLDVQLLIGLYTDIRSGRIVHPQTRYGPGTAPLFFRAKRGIRGCFVGKNSVRNCI